MIMDRWIERDERPQADIENSEICESLEDILLLDLESENYLIELNEIISVYIDF